MALQFVNAQPPWLRRAKQPCAALHVLVTFVVLHQDNDLD